jgi:ElaB/YqjD/DUF883 family membrane-anchored ribosome-binding protein
MSNTLSTANDLNPAAGSAQHPSVAQAANDLRVAAGDKARELVQTAETKAVELKDRAVETAQQFRETATERAAQLKANAAEKVSAFKTVATDKAQHIKECAVEQWEDTRVKAKEIHITAEDYVRQNPTTCVLGALGVGFLIGLVVRR